MLGRSLNQNSRSDRPIRPSAIKQPFVSFPITGKSSPADDIKSFVHKILAASQMFSRFYADTLSTCLPKSCKTKILAKQREKNVKQSRGFWDPLKLCHGGRFTPRRCSRAPRGLSLVSRPGRGQRARRRRPATAQPCPMSSPSGHVALRHGDAPTGLDSGRRW